MWLWYQEPTQIKCWIHWTISVSGLYEPAKYHQEASVHQSTKSLNMRHYKVMVHLNLMTLYQGRFQDIQELRDQYMAMWQARPEIWMMQRWHKGSTQGKGDYWAYKYLTQKRYRQDKRVASSESYSIQGWQNKIRKTNWTNGEWHVAELSAVY